MNIIINVEINLAVHLTLALLALSIFTLGEVTVEMMRRRGKGKRG